MQARRRGSRRIFQIRLSGGQRPQEVARLSLRFCVTRRGKTARSIRANSHDIIKRATPAGSCSPFPSFPCNHVRQNGEVDSSKFPRYNEAGNARSIIPITQKDNPTISGACDIAERKSEYKQKRTEKFLRFSVLFFARIALRSYRTRRKANITEVPLRLPADVFPHRCTGSASCRNETSSGNRKQALPAISAFRKR